jgi:hypothetical protein
MTFTQGDTDTVAEGSTNLYYTTARATAAAKAAISVTDSGGDGSLTYSAGAITYTGPSATETRGHFSGGTGVSITDGVVAIGQTVGTTSDVTFNNLTVSGDLTVSGTTTTVNTETLNLADNQIVLNSNETGEPTQNGGIEIERGTEDNKTLVWNETDDKWTVGSETFVAGTFEGALTGNATTATALTGNITTTGSTTITKDSTSISFNPVFTNTFADGDYTSSMVTANKLSLRSSSGKMLFVADIYEKVAKFEFQGGYYSTNNAASSGADQSVVQLKLTRRDPFTASGEKIGFIEFDGIDSAGDMETFVSIEGHIATNSANNQDGKLLLATARNGTFFSNYSADGHADKVELGKFKDLDLMAGADINGVAGSVKVWTGNGSTTLNSTFSGTDLTVVGTVNATTVDLGDWTITESGGTLYFATGGTNKMELDTSGNLSNAPAQTQATWETGTSTTEGLVSPAKVKAAIDALTEEPIGVGQTWQNMAGSRSVGTSYQNTTGRPIMVSICTQAVSRTDFQVSTDNSTWVSVGALAGFGNIGDQKSSQVIVPDDHYYRATGGSLIIWAELR